MEILAGVGRTCKAQLGFEPGTFLLCGDCAPELQKSPAGAAVLHITGDGELLTGDADTSVHIQLLFAVKTHCSLICFVQYA